MRKVIKYIFSYLALAAVVYFIALVEQENFQVGYDETELIIGALFLTLLLFAVGWLFVRFIAWLVYAISSAWHKGKQ